MSNMVPGASGGHLVFGSHCDFARHNPAIARSQKTIPAYENSRQRMY